MYLLLFPNGEEGWFPDIPMANQHVWPSRKVLPLSSGVEVDDANNANNASEASGASMQARFRVIHPA
jgi:hypothetical protein